MVGGNAVASWVATIDAGAVRNTRDIDLLVRRSDLPAITAALEQVGFVGGELLDVVMFRDGAEGKPSEAIHLLFAVLGFLFRRTERLRTVGGAYLFVFALMVPLVALAAYYFLLEGTISATGMLTLSALYAALVYLFLAWRVKFVAYAYMGWAYFGLKDADNFKKAAGKARSLGHKEPTLLQYLTRVEGGEAIK